MAGGVVVAAVLGAPAGPIVQAIMAAIPVIVMIGNRRRARVVRRLAALPFPIAHSRESAIAADSFYRSAIVGVTVRFAKQVDPAVLERAARDAQARAPGLTVTIAGDMMEMTGWPWRGDDLHLLGDLLSTWGCALHAEHAIAGVSVRWDLGGPASTL